MKLTRVQKSALRNLTDMGTIPMGCYHYKTMRSLYRMGLIVADTDSHDFVRLTKDGLAVVKKLGYLPKSHQ